MIKRNERGGLNLRTLDLSIMFDELFEICKTESEVEWLNDQLDSIMEGSMTDKLEDLEAEE